MTIGGDSPSFEAPEQPGTFIFQSVSSFLPPHHAVHGPRLIAGMVFPHFLVCRNPLVAFVYERGWRQGFAAAGFPGVDEEVTHAAFQQPTHTLRTWQLLSFWWRILNLEYRFTGSRGVAVSISSTVLDTSPGRSAFRCQLRVWPLLASLCLVRILLLCGGLRLLDGHASAVQRVPGRNSCPVSSLLP